MSTNGGLNPDLQKMAMEKIAALVGQHTVEKAAFIPNGDPAMMGGDPAAGGMPPGGDPAAGGMPPGGDPAMMGGDPAAGGMPPGGPPPMDPMMIQQMVQQAVQQAMPAAGGAGGGEGGIKPKIDINVEIMQMKNILAKIADAMGVQMPISDMVATPENLGQMAAGTDPASQMGGSGAAPPGGGLAPMQPMEPMGPAKTAEYVPGGEPYGDTQQHAAVTSRANALLKLRNNRR